MTTLLAALTLALIIFTAWRHWMVVRFFQGAQAGPLSPGASPGRACHDFGHAGTDLPRSPHAPCGVADRPHALTPTRGRGRARETRTLVCGLRGQNRDTHPPGLVSILQPILSGDPTLPQTLGHNLAARSSYAREFLWLVDEDDAAGLEICNTLIAAYPSATVRLLLQPPPPQGVNPKTFKLVNGLSAARGDVICVLDDDTMLPDGGLEQCLPYLQQPQAGLAFGLPYQVNFSNAWSSLIALFVNANSLPTYVPYASLHEPVTINGMFYALRRTVLDQMGGFSGLEPILADDFAVAQRVRSHGLHLVQTPLRHAISTQVPSLRRYLSLMQRWFIFPRESLLRHLPWREQGLVYALALAPTLLPLLLLLGLLLWPSPVVVALLAVYFAVSYAAFLHIDHAYLGHPTPTVWSFLVPVLQVVFPLQILAALLLPQRITWRGHVMQVERGGGFRFVKRR